MAQKLPKKSEGATATYESVELVCEKTGEYKGAPNFAWKVKSTGEPAFARVNGVITFVGSGNADSAPKAATINWPSVDLDFAGTDNVSSAVDLETKFTGLAVEVTRERYPEMSETSQTFGMIVNATKGHLINLAFGSEQE